MYPCRGTPHNVAVGPFPYAQTTGRLAGQDRQPLCTTCATRAAAGRARSRLGGPDWRSTVDPENTALRVPARAHPQTDRDGRGELGGSGTDRGIDAGAVMAGDHACSKWRLGTPPSTIGECHQRRPVRETRLSRSGTRSNFSSCVSIRVTTVLAPQSRRVRGSVSRFRSVTDDFIQAARLSAIGRAARSPASTGKDPACSFAPSLP